MVNDVVMFMLYFLCHIDNRVTITIICIYTFCTFYTGRKEKIQRVLILNPNHHSSSIIHSCGLFLSKYLPASCSREIKLNL